MKSSGDRVSKMTVPWVDSDAPGRLPVQEKEEEVLEEVVEEMVEELEARPALRLIPTTLCEEDPESRV